ncbi:unnamed protein product [Microthlaspi erraticum]|uniref:Uncharacterized protein n=1 Tax=Microthlaspi erraticum TaxID=1685480 RepID=A0A6D2JNZ0_9BRAS|nr:unnamed protein product [Microthlaspi erraticum]
MLEKTYTTFHKDHITLQQQYMLRGYTKFSDLIVALLVAEKNNELLIKNHMTRPAGSKVFPEANALDVKKPVKENNSFRGRGGRNNPDVADVGDTTQITKGHSNGIALNNLQKKSTKKTPPRSERLFVTDAVQRTLVPELPYS